MQPSAATLRDFQERQRKRLANEAAAAQRDGALSTEARRGCLCVPGPAALNAEDLCWRASMTFTDDDDDTVFIRDLRLLQQRYGVVRSLFVHVSSLLLELVECRRIVRTTELLSPPSSQILLVHILIYLCV